MDLLSSQRRRVVLDSNIWVDIFVFDDPVTRPLFRALQNGRLLALRDARCFDELARVLDYRQFAARIAARAGGRDAALDEARALSQPFDAPPAPAMPVDSGSQPSPRPIPQCRDPDDQKFIELACAAEVEWLVSKDRDVLRMGRRLARDFGIRVGPPAACVEAFALEADAKVETKADAKVDASADASADGSADASTTASA